MAGSQANPVGLRASPSDQPNRWSFGVVVVEPDPALGSDPIHGFTPAFRKVASQLAHTHRLPCVLGNEPAQVFTAVGCHADVRPPAWIVSPPAWIARLVAAVGAAIPQLELAPLRLGHFDRGLLDHLLGLWLARFPQVG